MNEQELNKKLAEWAGLINERDYTQSLDACLKWLVPKLQADRATERDDLQGLYLNPLRNNTWEAILWFYTGLNLRAIANTPALALCLAISKLIEQDVERK